MTEPTWIWPSNEEINDFPDPLGFEAEWREWEATMADGPSVYAEIFAREYLQNSWDSIQDQVAKMSSEGRVVPADHGVEFRFVRLVGGDAARFSTIFGLDTHATRLAAMSERDRRDNRLEGSCVAAENLDEVLLLVATETCGQGMSGPWKTGGRAGVVSRLKSALIQTKSDKDNEAAGGSWGHGKKAIANASTCRTIAVYTTFEEPDDGITTRFLGVSYWRSHDIGERSHVGLGLLGASMRTDGPFADQFRPLENDEAHDFIDQLGIDGLTRRDPNKPEELGTSYLIVEPSFGPNDLALALERNWWPLLERGSAALSIFDYDSEQIPLTPGDRTQLVPFLDALKLALGEQAQRERGDDVTKIVVSGKPAGKLALTSDDSEDGWSFDDPDSNWTLVALVRNDMVIAYERFPRKRRQKGPYLRGTLVVDREENNKASELLKMAEPHLHNVWSTAASPSVPSDAAAMAKAVLDSVQTRVTALRKTLKEVDHSVATHFPAFSQFFTEGRSPSVTPPSPPPPQPPRPFHIAGVSVKRLDANINDPALIRAESSAMLQLTEKQLTKSDTLTVSVSPGWLVYEESGGIKDDSLLDQDSIDIPSGFYETDGGFVGELTADPKKFTWRTNFYPDDWQIAPDPVVRVVNDGGGK